MALLNVLLSDMRPGRCSATVEIRLLRFWEARNVRKGGELMSVDMLFIDADSTVTQGTVAATRQLRFRDRLTEGSVYTLSGFDVVRSSSNFRLCDAPLMIRFNDGTSFDKKFNPERPIPTEHFRFMPYSRLLELANTGTQLPDIIGEVNAIRSTITDRIPGAQRVMLTLRLESGENVCVSMFDSMALRFHTKFDSYEKEPRVVIATSINPKIVGGRMFLNATSGTHLYFDCDTAASKEVFDTLTGEGTDGDSGSSKVVHAQKIEPVTVSELNKFIISAEPQTIEFLCTAKVTGIQTEEGWCYIGCATCSKKLIRETASFTCAHCNEANAVAALRYRVTLTVSDESDTASFLGFDMEIAKLTCLQASEAAQIVGVGHDAQVDTDIPLSLAGVVGKTYTFQLKLNDFNFSSKHQTFTISRIFPERALAPTPTFAGHDGGQTAEMTNPGVVPQATDGELGNPHIGGNKASTSANTSDKRPQQGEADSDVDENGRKKAHVG
ncbi:unnamed protein product [Eruca vesicaria subsp. sativa]|uniref:Replication factor A C-terminal domain-containing protein n=1 Tax=Eruca vesicaria subsp. sativa TaxID=29727 RepID=A0ABC8JJL2_ERUVS|nr:unnamed protein product [Eruca vesicaria subsp. sativa]